MRYVECTIIILCFLSIGYSQQDTTSFSSDTNQTKTDTFQSIKRTELSQKGFQSSKSALLAVALSTVLPGSGQFYNEDYWKIPIIWGFGIYWGLEWRYLNKKYKDFGSQYNESIKELPPYGDEQFRRLRDFYRDERDKFAWYIGVLYFLNIVDAYVGAHLYDFDVSPDLSDNISSDFSVGIAFRYYFR